MQENSLYDLAGRSFGVTAGTFLLDSIEDMIPWLIAMCFVILCDFVAGCRKSILMNQRVRFSRAWRATMGKMVTYFSFVVMVVLIEHACGSVYGIDKWSVLFICFIEGCSIISNILQPKGYDFDAGAALSVFTKRIFGVEKEETGRIIRKKKHDESVH